ncbi:hypothetical protein V6C31_10830, partial [Caldibacillus debilis]|uniref:hypothetical protein n=1 Tax=Caldibacillus debilis TaxID=301148 RepID=UPI002FD8BDCA
MIIQMNEANELPATGHSSQPKKKMGRLSQKVVKPTFWGQPLFLFLTIWLFIPFSKQEFLLISEFYPV